MRKTYAEAMRSDRNDAKTCEYLGCIGLRYLFITLSKKTIACKIRIMTW